MNRRIALCLLVAGTGAALPFTGANAVAPYNQIESVQVAVAGCDSVTTSDERIQVTWTTDDSITDLTQQPGGSGVTLDTAGEHTVGFGYLHGATLPAHTIIDQTFTLSEHDGTTVYDTKSISFDCTSGMLQQTISFGPLSDKPLAGAPFDVSASATSGLVVSFASDTTPVCTVSGATVTLVSTGLCTIRASQAGDATYDPAADVVQTFNVARPGQTISFPAIPGKLYGTKPFPISATATSGLPVTFSSASPKFCTVSSATVTVKAPGGCSIIASQAGDGTWNAAPSVKRTFVSGLTVQHLTPISGATVRRGATTVVRFQLAGAANKLIPDALATSLGCTVSVTLAAGGPVCATYNATTDTFTANVPVPNSLAAHHNYQLMARVTAPNVTVAKLAEPVITDGTATCVAPRRSRGASPAC